MYLELTDISKKIGADEVLSGITLSMEKGKVYGLQGKNGCGKSMLMRVICGLVLPTVGEVKIDGKILGKEFSFPPSVGVFIEKPELIILDEPSNALDEKSEEILWQIVGEEKERGALILISCHTTETLEKVSDEIFRMDMGQIKEHMTV